MGREYPKCYIDCPSCKVRREVGSNKGVCASCGQQFIEPQPGPQVAMMTSPARIVVFGGEAGGGKSAALVIDPIKYMHKYPGSVAMIFRRNTDELQSLWEKCTWWYPKAGGRLKNSPPLHAVFENTGKADSFIYLTHLDQTNRTVLKHDGDEIAYIGLDEGQYFTEFEIWYLFGRNRTSSGAPPVMRITCNPDPDCYLRRFISWWIDEDGYPIPERDGVIRWCVRPGEELIWFDTEAECQDWIDENKTLNPGMKPISVTFIKSTVEDNKIQGQDWIDEYKGSLALLDPETRRKKKDGNWNSPPDSGEMFNRIWFEILDRLPHESQIAYTVRAWDKAGSKPTKKNPDPDWTVGAKLTLLKSGVVIISDIIRVRDTPGELDKLIYHTALLDGPMCDQAFWIDPGQAGLVDEEHTRKLFAGLVTLEGGRLRALPNTLHFETCGRTAGIKVAHAKPWSAYADPATSLGRICLLRGDWNSGFLSEIEKFPKPKGEDGKLVKDDQVDAVSRAWIEIAKRLKSGKARKFSEAMSRARAEG